MNDYIHDELLRQRRAFLALTGGKKSGEAETDGENRTASGPETENGAAAANRTRADAGSPQTGESGGARAAVSMPQRTPLSGQTDYAAGGQTARPAVRLSFAEVPDEGAQTPARGQTPLLSADGAREFSRAFERDARRYDGGFPLY